jgi:hypothetical protein
MFLSRWRGVVSRRGDTASAAVRQQHAAVLTSTDQLRFGSAVSPCRIKGLEHR